MMEPMMKIIDDVAWELSELARKVTVVHYMPSALKEELRSYSARLYSVYNEYCYMEEEQETGE